ncbi:glycerol-3-phosphate dehydrogenase [Colwellia sp. C1TZA3]|uniref:glycerol-3-phosphate dehydrogenase n=1 Tax=Colwellia sp. C1TZA3 TaxID=2508879 RepID=UPI0011BA3E3A|nr:glycerol-3-phosphate dehydrogenase [Colwellia sp. C1TZA3]TWX72447.1 glycerol-3-phosphate dehydrogenase [Colwellia sp. C1TZA3]
MNGTNEVFDVAVIGGGINGAGVAADAAGRGLKVVLCEQNDLASATSSNSSKLIHGGLRYLEHYEFKLVKQALAEREILLKNAPHIITPLVFRLPHQRHLRPAWLIRIGLFLYDNLAKRVTLPASKGIKFSDDSPLVSRITKGFEYSDGWVDDARLVVLNALAAQDHGATIKTQTKCIKAVRENNIWVITLKDSLSGDVSIIRANSVINASGPWVAKLFSDALTLKSPQNIRLVKGSHIVVPRIHEQPEAYMLQNADQRIVFVIPFEDDFSLIGTTDVEYQGNPSEVKISDDEIDYLVNITNEYFKKKISREDIITTYSGVRPLLDDESVNAQAVTRDYTLELEDIDKKAPILSIFGGKITTYRKLAEAAVNKISPYFANIGPKWTANKPLPGGNFANIGLLTEGIKKEFPWLPSKLRTRLIRSYGTRIFALLSNINSIEAMGYCFGADLYEQEVNFLIQQEWAVEIDDVIWRRTKRGLYLSEQQVAKLKQHLDDHPAILARKSLRTAKVA